MINERVSINNIREIRRKTILKERKKKILKRRIIVAITIFLVCFGILKFIDIYGESTTNNYDNIDVSKDISSSKIPLFLQGDKRWGNLKYGNDTIEKEGCGPTCLAMVIVGLTKDSSINPKVVAEYSKKAGYYDKDYGTKWALMTEGAANYNLNSYEVPLDKSSMINELKNGHPIICSVGPGHFTKTGHFIILKGYTKNGEFEINDPNSKKRSERTWSYEEISNEIRGIWSFSYEK